MHPLLRPSFWFDVTPVPLLSSSAWLVWTLMGAIFFLGIVSRSGLLVVPKKSDLWRVTQRVSQYFLSVGVVGVLLYWFSFERFPFFSMRFLYLAWLVWTLAWGALLVWFVVKTLPARRREQTERTQFEKYLP